jgi:enoyl-CoA hydratase/carnithine racemase
MSLVVARGPVWTVTLDRPGRANALSAAVVEQLHAVLDEAALARPDALVLRGNERHFASGLDLTGLHDETDASLAHRFLRIGLLLEKISAAPYLTVAVVEGAAVGAGADLVAACDHRLAAPTATFRFPGSRFGVVLGTRRLAALTGTVSLASGHTVPADEAGGLVTGCPQELDRIVGHWSMTAPVARPSLLAAARPPHDLDAAFAALARSVSVPGLRDRVAEHAERTFRKENVL